MQSPAIVLFDKSGFSSTTVHLFVMVLKLGFCHVFYLN
jgi:hypothetical protein